MEITIKFNDTDILFYKEKIFEIVNKASTLEKTKVEIMQQGGNSSTITPTQDLQKEKVQKEQSQQCVQEQQPQATQQQQKEQQSQYTPNHELLQIQQAAVTKATQIENGPEKIRALVKKYGANRLSDIDRKYYISFMQDLEALK